MEGLVNSVIRPPRSRALEAQLGPRVSPDGRLVREELVLRNARRLPLACSLLRPPGGPPRPALLVGHGNASNRAAGASLRDFCVRHLGVAVLALDFAGCGDSGGEYISLGYYEQDDLAACVEYLSARPECSSIAILGRSMGAMAAMMYARKYKGKHPKVACLVFDGIFESLRVLMGDLGKHISFLLGLRPVAAMGTAMIRRACLKRAHFDIDDVVALNSDVTLPALFLAAEEDELFPRYHIENVYKAYAGPKLLVDIEGGHDTFRGARFWQALEPFLREHLKIAHESVPFKQPSSPAAIYCAVLPFEQTPDPVEPLKIDFGAPFVPWPLIPVIEEEGLHFVAPFFEGRVVYRLDYTQFQGLLYSSNEAHSSPTVIIISVSETQGFLVHCPNAATARELHAQIEAAMSALLRKQFLNDLPQALARVRQVARILLDNVEGDPESAKAIDKVTDTVMNEICLTNDDTVRKAVREAVAEAAAQQPPPTISMQ